MATDLLAPPNEADEEARPDGQEADAPDSGYGENNVKLPEQLQNALKSLVREFQMQDKYDRRREVLRDRRNRFYERGHQHLWQQGGTGVLQIAAPGAIIQNSAGQSVQCPTSMRVYNIFFPFERVVTSILTQNPPGVDFLPDNPNSPEDIEAAETAEGYRNHFDRMNDVKQIQSAIVRMLLLSGRTVTWTYTKHDEFHNPESYQTTEVFGTLESKVPIIARCLGECLYVFLSKDKDVKILKHENPDFADKIVPSQPGLGEDNYERIARLGVLQGGRTQAQIGDAMQHVTTEMHCWLRPAAFESDKLGDPFEEGNHIKGQSALTVQEELKRIFPTGVHCVFVGETYVASWDEQIEKHLAVDFPYAGDGMSRMAAMDPMITVQDDFNDDMNAYHEVKEYGWPSRYLKGEEDDLDAIGDQVAAPYAYRAWKGRADQPLAQEFHQEQDPNIPPTLWQSTQFLMGQLAQFILAAPPALFGESMPDQKTASGYAQARAQAMGQQGIPWMAVQRLWAQVYKQAAQCAIEDPNAQDEIVVPGANGTNTTYSLSKLNGNFGAYPDEDSSFPESTSAKRANLTQLLTLAAQSPQGAQLFESPDNWEEIKNLLGFSELVLPEALARDKQLAELEVLLQQAPVPPPQQLVQKVMVQHAAATLFSRSQGQAPPPPLQLPPASSSVPVEPLDYHVYEFEKCKEWLSSSDRRRAEAAGNHAGVQNVILHANEHQKFIALMAPPPMPAPVPHAAPHPPQGEHAAPKHPIAAPPGAPGTATF